MKITKKFLMFASFCILMCIGSCKKDKESKEGNSLERYFSIENATFIDGQFPAASSANAPVVNSVFGNSSILEGGSNPITINTSGFVKNILVGVEGKIGYYKVAAGNKKAASIANIVYLLFSQDFEEDDFSILIAIIDNEGMISERETVNVSRIVAGTGKLQVSCSWDKPNDLDLHLVEPNLDEICWRTDIVASGGVLDVDSNPICILDYINSENITYSGTATVENGKYIVRISLFRSCEVTEATNFVVTARLNGNLITPITGKNPYYGSIEAAHSYIDGDGPREGETVMEFSVPAKKSGLVGEQELLQFKFPKKKNLTKLSLYN